MLLINNSFRSVGALGLLMVAAGAAHAGSHAPQKASAESRAMDQGRRLLADRSARFVENKGQWNREARFLAKGQGLDLWYTDHGIRYDQIDRAKGLHQAVDMFLVGGRLVRPVGSEKLNSRQDVYHGNLTVRNIGAYKELTSKDVVPGVSMRSYFDGGKPRYDLILAPGTSPSALRLGFHGANGLSTEKGSLKISTKLGGIYNGKPYAYQTVGGKKVPVVASWTVAQGGIAAFKVGSYDSSKPLVIDPLVYGTYFGGELGPEEIRAAAVDTFGGVNRLVIVGSSAASDYPGTSRPFTDTLNPQGTDAFIARIVPDGTATDYSVLLGGAGTDIAQYVKIDATSKDIWLAGTTIARTTGSAPFNNFPSTIDPATGNRRVIGSDSVAGAANFFVGRFTHASDGTLDFGSDTPTGTQTARVATVFGTGIAFNPTGSVFMSGFDIAPFGTNQFHMALVGVADSALPASLISRPTGVDDYGYTFPGHRTGFILRFLADGVNGGSIGYFAVNRNVSQYVMGLRASEIRGVALDSLENAYVIGTTYAPAAGTGTNPINVDTAQNPAVFDTTPNAIADANGTTVLGRILRNTDIFVRIYGNYFTTYGRSALVFSGAVGGNGDDEAGGIAASPIVNGGFNPVYTGSAIAIDSDRNIYFTGTTRAAENFPHTAGAFGGAGFVPPSNGDANVASDVVVGRISAGGGRLDYAANLKTTARQLPLAYGRAFVTSAMPAGIAVDNRGYVYLTGNLRPYSIIFPDTYTAPAVFEPSSSTPSTIQLTSGALDTTYDFPTQGPFPSIEGFVTVLTPDLTALQYSSYIGGSLDDMVFAPTFDAAGNVLVMGWTDGVRVYNPPNRTSPAYVAFSDLPGLISGNAIKTNPNSTTPPPALFTTNFGYSIWKTQGYPFDDQPVISPVAIGKDGFVSSIGVSLPALPPLTLSLTFNPTAIGAAGTSTATLTLGTVQSTSTRVNLTFSPNLTGVALTGVSQDVNGYYVVVPANSQTVTFSVKSTTINLGSTLTVTANVAKNGQTATASATLAIGALDFKITFDKPTLQGTNNGTNVTTGTITLVAPTPAPTAITFAVTVTAASQSLLQPGSFTVQPDGSLKIATVTIAAGATSGTFTIAPRSVNTPTILTVTATTVATVGPPSIGVIARTGAITVQPISLVSVSVSPSPIRGNGVNSQATLTITFDGAVAANGSNLVISTNVKGALAGVPATIPDTRFAGKTIYTVSFNVNRVSRSQDVLITVSYNGTTVSTVLTITR